MKIVADDKIPYIKGLLEPFAEIVYRKGSEISPADVADADALLVRTRTRCDERLLFGSKVRFVATATIGTDHIDLEYCATAGITVATAAGSNAGGVLQWVAATLAQLSDIDGWQPCQKCLGIVGVGNVGRLVERYAKEWDFRVLCCDPLREQAEGLGVKQGYVPFATLAAEADIITFHTPLTCDGSFPTYHLAGSDFFNTIKQGCVVLNSSRGGVVNTKDLKRVIDAGVCRCCLDVWEGEPAIDKELLAAALVATPHIAGYSAQGKANASAMIVAALSDYFGLGIDGWYPAEVLPLSARLPISWSALKATIKDYCNLQSETMALKEYPEQFESFRENYDYRQEYF